MKYLSSFTRASILAGCILAANSSYAQQKVGDVFVLDFENNNWTQPSAENSASEEPIFGNAAAPYINSLVTPGNANATYVSYATAYHNVLSTPTGNNPSIHPSEPNYLWQEAGTNYNSATGTGNNGIANDNDPYGSGNNVAAIAADEATAASNGVSISPQNFSGLLQSAGISWKSYQEDTDLATTTGGNVNNSTLGTNALTSNAVAPAQYTVPLKSFSGTSTNYVNPYNGSNQYNFAPKHDGQLFYADTNGGNDASTANVESAHYAPMQQLQADLNNNTVGAYNLITPDQYNDMHTALTGGFTYHGVTYTSDNAQIAQGDNFLSIVVPEIMASQAFQNNGVIIIWTDETEGTNQNDFNHTLMEIVISKLAKGNAYASTLDYTHSSDLATLQEIYGVSANTPTGYLNDAANLSNGTSPARDLSDMFQPNVIPTTVPEPGSIFTVAIGALGLAAWGTKRRRLV